MRVLHVYDVGSPIGGGSQIITYLWLKNLESMGHTVRLVSNDTPYMAHLFGREKIFSVPSFPLNVFLPEFRLPLFATAALKKSIYSFNPEVIHLHEPSPLAWWMAKFAKKNRFPLLFTFHTNHFHLETVNGSHKEYSLEYKTRSKIAGKIQKAIMSYASAVSAPSLTYLSFLKNRVKGDIIYSPYPIPLDFFVPPYRQNSLPRKLITVSRLAPEKNIAFLIECMRHVDNRFTLTVVGDGIEKKRLQKMTARYGLEKTITFTGWIPHAALPQVLTKHDLFLSASAFETFGLTYMEALAARLPLMVYDYPTSREIVPSSMAVHIASLSPSLWATYLLQLQDDSSLYRLLCRNINAHYSLVQQYSEQSSTRTLYNIYRTLTNQT